MSWKLKKQISSKCPRIFSCPENEFLYLCYFVDGLKFEIFSFSYFLFCSLLATHMSWKYLEISIWILCENPSGITLKYDLRIFDYNNIPYVDLIIINNYFCLKTQLIALCRSWRILQGGIQTPWTSLSGFTTSSPRK